MIKHLKALRGDSNYCLYEYGRYIDSASEIYITDTHLILFYTDNPKGDLIRLLPYKDNDIVICIEKRRNYQ